MVVDLIHLEVEELVVLEVEVQADPIHQVQMLQMEQLIQVVEVEELEQIIQV